MSLEAQNLPKILVFDSGVGGFSIVNELKIANININVFYLADTFYFPYGSKSDLDLIDRIPKLIKAAAEEIKPDVIIIACNTASTIALWHIRQIVNIPIIGVVPAIKPAAKHTKSKTIGLLATPRTVGSAYTESLINEYASDCEVIRYGPKMLARAAEDYIISGTCNHEDIKDAIDGLFKQKNSEKIDIIILACTHYPLVKNLLNEYLPHKAIFIDSGSAIARRAGEILFDRVHSGEANLLTAYSTGGDNTKFNIAATNFGFKTNKELRGFNV